MVATLISLNFLLPKGCVCFRTHSTFRAAAMSVPKATVYEDR
jgi:hypothetical protein